MEIQGAHFLVTVDQPECLALREWLDWELDGTRTGVARSTGATGSAGATPEARYSRTRRVHAAVSEAAGGERGHRGGRPTAQTAPPGEFTQLFERSGRSGRPEPPPPAAPSMPAPSMPAHPCRRRRHRSRRKISPESLQGCFGSPLAPPSEGSSGSHCRWVHHRNQRPGEFTRVFGGGTPIATSGSSPAAPTPVSNTSFRRLAYLTESLEPRQRPAAPPAVAAASAGPGEFTRVIQRPVEAAAAGFTRRRLVSHRRPPRQHRSRCPRSPTAPPLPVVVYLTASAAGLLTQIPAPPQMPSVSFATPSRGANHHRATADAGDGHSVCILLLAAFALVLFVILRR